MEAAPVYVELNGPAECYVFIKGLVLAHWQSATFSQLEEIVDNLIAYIGKDKDRYEYLIAATWQERVHLR
jgi:hypothetical protein